MIKTLIKIITAPKIRHNIWRFVELEYPLSEREHMYSKLLREAGL